MPRITEAEYGRWITPREAVERLGQDGRDEAEARKIILDGLAAGSLIAVASRIDPTIGGQRRPASANEMLVPGKWAAIPGIDSKLWERDEVTYVKTRSPSGSELIYECSGVRIEPSGLERLAIQPAKRAVPPPPSSTARSVAPRDYSPEIDAERVGDLTASDYEQWWEPKELLAALPQDWPWETKVRNIAGLLEDGLVRAIAGAFAGDGKSAERVLLPQAVWKGWACLADQDFWASGFREVFADHPHYRGRPFRAYRIRLERSAVARHLPVVDREKVENSLVQGVESDGPMPQRRRKVSPSEMQPKPQPADPTVRRWLEKHEAKFPGQVHHQLRSAFDRAHPNFSVGKRQLYRIMTEVRGGLRVGNPIISRSRGGK
jgi:hypothetical protein